MTFPALLMFIFAPVLGLLVRVRAFAVVAALVCVVGLPVGGSAWAQAQWGESAPAGWEVECVDDEWDDVRICEAFTNKFHFPLIAYHCKGTEKQSVLFAGGILLGEIAVGKWEFTEPAFLKERLPGAFPDLQIMRKVQIRWDKEPVHEGILLSDANSPFGSTASTLLYSWVWGKFPPDWRVWEDLKMTPTTLPNPVPLLQTKNQLRIRSENGQVLTFPLAGAREAIAKAKRGCGF